MDLVPPLPRAAPDEPRTAQGAGSWSQEAPGPPPGLSAPPVSFTAQFLVTATNKCTLTLSRVGEFGCPRRPHTPEIVGSNPTPATRR